LRLFQDALYEEISAVATLMYHCGASVEMDYAPGGSGASSQQIPLSLHEYCILFQAYIKIKMIILSRNG
jgi:hypothetical protein